MYRQKGNINIAGVFYPDKKVIIPYVSITNVLTKPLEEKMKKLFYSAMLIIKSESDIFEYNVVSLKSADKCKEIILPYTIHVKSEEERCIQYGQKTVQEEKMGMEVDKRFCVQCGSKLEDGWKTCPFCGEKR